MAIDRNGQMLQADFFENTGGLNLISSPFTVGENQATDGFNFDYGLYGAIQQPLAHRTISGTDSTNQRAIGLASYTDTVGIRTPIRFAMSVMQSVTITNPLTTSASAAFTTISSDTSSPSSTFFSTTLPAVSTQFNTSSARVLWVAGGGMQSLQGIYSTSKTTTNGVPAPTGTMTPTLTTSSTTSFVTSGTFRYTLAFRKASTQALSNGGMDVSAVLTTTANNVILTFNSFTNMDTTRFDQIWVYRSAVGGSADFTTGDLIAQLASSATSYTDTGSSILSSQNVPRANSTVLDNSMLTTGEYRAVTTWKRRLVTANGSILSISDLNKPESWPTANTITIPSAGPITGLAIISFSTDFSNDELLAVFKERELWIVTGNSISDWSLKFIDSVGCANQSMIVLANGWLCWLDYRGIFIWNGSDKPIYCSRLIEPLFNRNGVVVKELLNQGVGFFYRDNSQIVWFISNSKEGTDYQTYAIKMDLRLTLPSVSGGLDGRVIDGVFTVEKIRQNSGTNVYGVAVLLDNTLKQDTIYLANSTGNIYYGYFQDQMSVQVNDDVFNYRTKWNDFGNPNIRKRFSKVIVWVEKIPDADLILRYRTGYRKSSLATNVTTLRISDSSLDDSGLWDAGSWDVAIWDDTATLNNYIPLVFNLNAGQGNNNEGDSLQLEFAHKYYAPTLKILGFSVLFNVMGLDR